MSEDRLMVIGIGAEDYPVRVFILMANHTRPS